MGCARSFVGMHELLSRNGSLAVLAQSVAPWLGARRTLPLHDRLTRAGTVHTRYPFISIALLSRFSGLNRIWPPKLAGSLFTQDDRIRRGKANVTSHSQRKMTAHIGVHCRLAQSRSSSAANWRTASPLVHGTFCHIFRQLL